LLNSLERINL